MSVKKLDNSQEQQENNKQQENTKNIQVSEDVERNLVVLKIYGVIEEPELYVGELALLELLSSKYDVIEITLNSPGGSLNTMVDLASIINNYDYVVTIGKGEVASAAFMLWSMGDLKVVTDFSMYMAHRESYGMYGKTSEHQDAALIFGDVYKDLFESCFNNILTKKEKRIAERSEAWVSYKDLLKRDGIISYDEYLNVKNPYQIAEAYLIDNGMTFMFDLETNSYREVEIIFKNHYIDDMTDYLYGITNVKTLNQKKKKKKKK